MHDLCTVIDPGSTLFKKCKSQQFNHWDVRFKPSSKCLCSSAISTGACQGLKYWSKEQMKTGRV